MLRIARQTNRPAKTFTVQFMHIRHMAQRLILRLRVRHTAQQLLTFIVFLMVKKASGIRRLP